MKTQPQTGPDWTISLSATLIAPGEEVSVEMTGTFPKGTPGRAWLHRFSDQGEHEAKAIPLRWNEGVGQATLRPEACGNYFVSPDREPTPNTSAYRYLAVIDHTYHLFHFAITLTPEDYGENVHGNFLTADYWPSLSAATSDQLDRLRLFERKFGDVVTPHLFPQDLATGSPEGEADNPNWYRYSDARIEQFLTEFQRRWLDLGFDRADAFATYCHSTSLVRVAQRMGFQVIGGLVSEHNHSLTFMTHGSTIEAAQ